MVSNVKYNIQKKLSDLYCMRKTLFLFRIKNARVQTDQISNYIGLQKQQFLEEFWWIKKQDVKFAEEECGRTGIRNKEHRKPARPCFDKNSRGNYDIVTYNKKVTDKTFSKQWTEVQNI